MVSDSNLKARIPAECYRHHAYQPDWVAVTVVKAAILPPQWQGRIDAMSAIDRTARDPVCPVIYKPGTGDSALTIERGPRGQVNARLKDWIERHDPSELPFGLK
jgi:hypothetical protein